MQLCKRDGSFFGTSTVEKIGAGETIELALTVNGERIPADALQLELAVTGDYEDANGFVSQGVQDKVLDVTNAALQFQPAW